MKPLRAPLLALVLVAGVPCASRASADEPRPEARARVAITTARETVYVGEPITLWLELGLDDAWFQAHAPEANAVLEDVLTLAARLCDTPLTPALRQQVQHALNVHAALPARGRTSLARLQRARAHAARLGLRLNTFLGE